MNLGGGAVVQGDYRLLSSKLWEGPLHHRL